MIYVALSLLAVATGLLIVHFVNMLRILAGPQCDVVGCDRPWANDHQHPSGAVLYLCIRHPSDEQVFDQEVDAVERHANGES